MIESSDSTASGSEISGNNEIISLIKNLEARISRLESALNIEPVQGNESIPDQDLETVDADKEEQLEYRIGQLWFAKAGIIILIIGLIFFLTFPYKNLPSFIPGLFGYFITALFLIVTHYSQKNYYYFSGYILGGGLTLLYFTTARLYLFNQDPVITSLPFELLLLVLVVLLSLFISIKRKSIYLTTLSLTFGYVTAIISDEAFFFFVTILLISLLSVYLTFQYEWDNLIFFSIVFSYLTHLLWFINNPLMGKAIQTETAPQINLIFILLYLITFAGGNLFRRKQITENYKVSIISALNVLLGYGLYCIIILSLKQESIFAYHFTASILLLIISFLFWIREKSKYSTFIYAMSGYLALSIAIIAQSKPPELFIWLCWQSLLVVSTAVWFRSKFIVLANFIIYIIIFIAYLFIAGKADIVSISFGIVALLSARILNWKKDRLELKTEQMRNAYLLAALFIIPYALYFVMPESLISVSWILVAVLYYVLSLILKNKKYRWMSLLTFLLTIIYVFIIGITSSDPLYKIISFIALGGVLISISVLYTKLRKSIWNKS